MGDASHPSPRLVDLAEPLVATRAAEALGSFESQLSRGLPAVCLVGGEWRLLLPRQCVGYSRARQFRDLPHEPAEVALPETPCALALSAVEHSCGFVVVAEGEQLVGAVRRARLVAHVVEEAARAEGLARLLEASLDATARACWYVELEAAGTDLFERPLRYVGPFAELLGVAVDRGAPVREWVRHVVPEDRAAVKEHLRGLAADGVARTVSYRVKLAGTASPRWMEDAAAAIVAPDGKHILFGFVRDVTRERERAERATQQARLAAVGHLAARMAHETNNMLAIIGGSLALLGRAGAEPDIVARELDHIREATERLGWLTRQIVALGGKEPRRVGRVDANALLGDATDALRDALGPKVDLEIAGPDEPSVIEADPTQLRQALVHLAANAREAMPDGGRFVLQATRRAAEGSDPEVLEVRVSDTGPGIPSEAIPRVFDPYFTTKEAGTGLGLAIVQGAIAQNGGSIRVERTDATGTCFLIELPIASGSPSAPTPDPVESAAVEDAPMGRPRTVLVVDDEPALRRIAGRLLERAGFRIVAAASAEEALRVLASGEFDVDVLVTDLAMPGLSGADLARAVRELDPELPIVYVSGHFDHAAFDGIQDLPAGIYLAKPFAPAALIEAVRRSTR